MSGTTPPRPRARRTETESARGGRIARGRRIAAPLVPTLLFLAACGADIEVTDPGDNPLDLSYDFTQGTQGWEAGFADYPPGEEQAFQLVAEVRPLPEELGSQDSGFFVSGNNLSDDLFMFLKREVEGVEPNRRYNAHFRVRFATNAASGCSGIGGAPGEGVFVKAGAAAVEPVAVVQAGILRLNVDKGNQGEGGSAAKVMGDIAGTSTDCTDAPYEIKEVETGEGGVEVTTGSERSLWLLVGTDSGFEGTTSLFYLSIDIALIPQ